MGGAVTLPGPRLRMWLLVHTGTTAPMIMVRKNMSSKKHNCNQPGFLPCVPDFLCFFLCWEGWVAFRRPLSFAAARRGVCISPPFFCLFFWVGEVCVCVCVCVPAPRHDTYGISHGDRTLAASSANCIKVTHLHQPILSRYLQVLDICAVSMCALHLPGREGGVVSPTLFRSSCSCPVLSSHAFVTNVRVMQPLMFQ